MKLDSNNLKDIDLNDKEVVKSISSGIYEKMRRENKSLAEVLNVAPELINELYHLGYTFYGQGKFKEAVSLFYYLTTFSPNEFKYIYALSAAFHQLKEFEQAASGFTLAYMIEPQNPLPVYYVADCLLQTDQKEAALEVIETTITICGEIKEHQALKERCLLIKNSLNKQLSK